MRNHITITISRIYTRRADGRPYRDPSGHMFWVIADKDHNIYYANPSLFPDSLVEGRVLEAALSVKQSGENSYSWLVPLVEWNGKKL